MIIKKGEMLALFLVGMFKKPFQVTGNTKLKKALLKKVRVSAGKSLLSFDDLPEEEIARLIPSRAEDFDITKIKGTKISYYSYKDCPVLIDVNGVGLTLVMTRFWPLPSCEERSATSHALWDVASAWTDAHTSCGPWGGHSPHWRS